MPTLRRTPGRKPSRDFRKSQTSEVSGRETSANPKHQKSQAARPPQIPNIRSLRPRDLRKSQTSEVSGRETSANPKHPKSQATRPPQIPNIRGLRPRDLRKFQTSEDGSGLTVLRFL